MSLLPLVAALFAVPQFLPQLARLRRTGDAAGVSCAWAALTSVNNGAWTAYFALSRLWTALAPSISATLLAGILAVWLARRGELPRRAALSITGWAALLAVAGGVFGRAALGTALAASFILQTAPSVWKAYRSERVSGISAGTWLLILGELLCWGVYGTYELDPRLMVLGWTGVAASLLILTRVAAQARSRTLDRGTVSFHVGQALRESGPPGLAGFTRPDTYLRQIDELSAKPSAYSLRSENPDDTCPAD
jgi:uncharacterized protein with PQ loop repeat